MAGQLKVFIWREIGASCAIWPSGTVTFVSTVKWRPGRKKRSAC